MVYDAITVSITLNNYLLSLGHKTPRSRASQQSKFPST